VSSAPKFARSTGRTFGRTLLGSFTALTLTLGVVASSAASTAPAPVRITSLSVLEGAVVRAQTQKIFPTLQLSRVNSSLALSSYQGPCEVDQRASAAVNTHCWFGDLQSTKKVVLYGDSLAGMWQPALAAIGAHDHFKVLVIARKACPFAALPPGSYVDVTCPLWKANAVALINSLQPLVVILAEKNLGPTVDAHSPNASQSAFTTGETTSIADINAPTKLVLLGFPYFNPGGGASTDPATCLQAMLAAKATLLMCDTPALQAFSRSRLGADKAAVTAAGAHVVNLTPMFCGHVNCPIVINQQIAMANRFHTPTWFAKMTTFAMRDLLRPYGL
jgi:hypothetical protein